MAVEDSLTVFWLFINGVLVFFMQSGFGMLEAGAVQRKNVKNILIKNLTDVCAAAISFFLFGFAFAYGGNGDFLGDEDYFGGHCLSRKYSSDACETGYGFVDWFFQFAFAATAATIVSGSVAERTQFSAYLIYSTVITGLIYPAVVHWVWGGGFLAQEGVHDFAGSGVVHMTGGVAGLAGAIVIGAREGRFEGPRFRVTTKRFQESSIVFVGLGTFILWTGWYGFNTGSTLALSGNEAQVELVIMNTTLAPAACGLTCLVVTSLFSYRAKGADMSVRVEPMMNGILAGLVSITAGCAAMEPSMAIVTGVVGAVVYLTSSELLKQLKIDDPLDAAPVHYFCGCWGVIAVGFFATENYANVIGLSDHGVFFGGNGKLLGWQLVAVLTITTWVGGLCLILFAILHHFGLARVSKAIELSGLDEHHHGGKDKYESVTLEVVKRVMESRPTRVSADKLEE